VPKGTAPGIWSVSQITLTSNAGVTAVYGNLNAAPITMTDDTGFTASDFSVSPNPVDNWRATQTVNVTLTPSGARGGISAVYVNAYVNASYCPQWSTTPTINADGSVSVPLHFDSGAASCQISGIVVVDGAGDVALYGQDYYAPDPNLIINRTPDTTAPTASSASVSPTTIAQSAIPSTFVTTTVVASVGVAPINQFDLYIYDSSGNVVDQALGGVSQAADGTVQLDTQLPYGQAPGTYTIGFTLYDAGGLSNSYGTPHGQPMPGGPLQLTVTAG
jgi:hypothetical protein